MIWKPTKQYGHMHTHNTKKETYATEEININNNLHAVLTYYFKKNTSKQQKYTPGKVRKWSKYIAMLLKNI